MTEQIQPYTWNKKQRGKVAVTSEGIDGVPDWYIERVAAGVTYAKMRSAARPFYFSSVADAIRYADGDHTVKPIG